MAQTAINYLFPPDCIEELPTWRFVLHFKPPFLLRGKKIRQAVTALKQQTWSAIEFPCDLEELEYDSDNKVFSIPVEVPEDRRAQPDSLADYESDVWKIYGNMVEHGFGDLYYEAIDFQE